MGNTHTCLVFYLLSWPQGLLEAVSFVHPTVHFNTDSLCVIEQANSWLLHPTIPCQMDIVVSFKLFCAACAATENIAYFLASLLCDLFNDSLHSVCFANTIVIKFNNGCTVGFVYSEKSTKVGLLLCTWQLGSMLFVGHLKPFFWPCLYAMMIWAHQSRFNMPLLQLGAAVHTSLICAGLTTYNRSLATLWLPS